MRDTVNPLPRRVLRTGIGLAVFLAVAHTMTDTFASMLTALLPTLQVRFGLTESALALLVATLSFSTSVTQPFLGALADRYGTRLAGALGIVLVTSLLSLISVAPTLPLLFVLLFVGGLGSAAFHPAGTSLARAAYPRNTALAVSLFGAGGTLGLALGPIVVLAVVASSGLSVMPWLMVPGIVLGILTYFMLPAVPRRSRATHSRLLNVQLFRGPVGLLSVAGILSSVPVVTFSSAVPLWLVASHGVARDSALIGWTLAIFSLSGAAGGLLSGVLSTRVSPRLLITGSMLLTPLPLLALLAIMPATPLFFLAVIAAGVLANASLPLLVLSAQDMAPDDMAAASGMLLGFATGMAGLLYIGIGRLQEVIGLGPAMRLSFLLLIPAALLAWYVLGGKHTRSAPAGARAPRDGANRVMSVSMTCKCSACVFTPSPDGDDSAARPHAGEHVTREDAGMVVSVRPTVRPVTERV